MKKALIIWGGWEGHQPKEVGEILHELLVDERYEVEMSNTLDSLIDEEKLKGLDLIVPVWTMGSITREQSIGLLAAVKSGVGIAGCHGGMGDAFRIDTEYQFMVGGQWVAHPGNDGVRYTVNLGDHPIVDGIGDFEVSTEKYYMHVDPAIEVLATTTFEGYGPNGADMLMPVAWTKKYGDGRVFYCSLGHQANIISIPQVSTIMRRGMVWASK
ncbi:ThuA domain-containing protein [Paenibacillus sp. LHD-117]|uniref:ThuA domain-containing protein n=1 Tax=Paenibacillus sp. LHD-117 TaxID=3071412 RepID=UPI0027E153F3|nr:ThuA domain-containing protein [Paenibacillus sp. LHD-117]MDQ6420184.1 ThuA domain-containing protein [Paenibacillus sp. LHD-117]